MLAVCCTRHHVTEQQLSRLAPPTLDLLSATVNSKRCLCCKSLPRLLSEHLPSFIPRKMVNFYAQALSTDLALPRLFPVLAAESVIDESVIDESVTEEILP